MDTVGKLCILCLVTLGYAEYPGNSSMTQQPNMTIPPQQLGQFPYGHLQELGLLQQHKLEPPHHQQQLGPSTSQFKQVDPSSQQLPVPSRQQFETPQQLVAATPQQLNSSQQRLAPLPKQLQSSHPQLGPSPQQLESRHQQLQSEQSPIPSYPVDPHKSKVNKEVMDVYDSIPIPHLKYDVNENPVLSYGHDGLADAYGDRKALHGEFSHYVQIRYNDILICGAALIESPVTRKQVVVSATHCLVEAHTSKLSNPKRYALRMGVIGKNEQGQTRNVKKVLVHPGFTLFGPSRRSVFHDIGLLIPDREFELNEYVSTIALPRSPLPIRGDIITVKGFGKGREAGHNGIPNFMRTLEVPVWDLTKCAQIYLNESENHIITEAHFCAGNYLGGVDTCQGDSGGPAMILEKGQRYLVGVVSWGKGCGKKTFPGVYARVWSYNNWITSTLYDYEINGIFPRLPKYPQ